MIKAVLFDLDDTLIDRQKNVYDLFSHLIDEKLPNLQDPMLREAMIQDCILWDQFGNVTRPYIVERLERKYGVSLGDFDAIQWWLDNQGKYIHRFPETLPVLDYLKEKYLLGLVTNGTVRGQNEKVDAAGIRDYFSAIIISNEHEMRKPDQRLFEMALDKLGVTPRQAVYVGDTFSNDVYGAYRAGLKPIWLKTYNRCFTEEKNIQVIDSLLQLKDLL